MNEKVWGESEGLCAWCNAKAQTSYTGKQAGGEEVSYQVCRACDKEMGECERVAYDRESWYCLTHNQLERREEANA